MSNKRRQVEVYRVRLVDGGLSFHYAGKIPADEAFTFRIPAEAVAPMEEGQELLLTPWAILQVQRWLMEAKRTPTG